MRNGIPESIVLFSRSGCPNCVEKPDHTDNGKCDDEGNVAPAVDAAIRSEMRAEFYKCAETDNKQPHRPRQIPRARDCCLDLVIDNRRLSFMDCVGASSFDSWTRCARLPLADVHSSFFGFSSVFFSRSPNPFSIALPASSCTLETSLSSFWLTCCVRFATCLSNSLPSCCEI